MNDIFDIENTKIDYGIYDKVICNDKNQFDRILNSNKEIFQILDIPMSGLIISKIIFCLSVITLKIN